MTRVGQRGPARLGEGRVAEDDDAHTRAVRIAELVSPRARRVVAPNVHGRGVSPRIGRPRDTVYAVDIRRRVGVHVVGVQKWNDVHLERMHDDGQAATRELVGRCGRRARAFHLWEGVSPPPVVFAANPRAARYRAKRSRRQTSLGCNARGCRRAAALGEGSATGAITLSRRGRGFDSALGAVGTFPSTSTCCWSREQLRETERGVRFWERPKRPSGSRVRAHDGELR